MSGADPERLSAARLVAYSAPSLVTSVAALPMALFVPAFYSDDLGVPLAAVGGAIAASNPLGRIGSPEDMAGIAIFLASRAGAYVNAAVLPVDGGMSGTR